MVGIFKKQTKKDRMVEARRKRRDDEQTNSLRKFDASQVISICLFFSMACALIVICFLGQSPAQTPVLPNQISKVRIVADFPYEYASKIQTDRLREEHRQRVAPFYRLNLELFNNFSKQIDLLLRTLNDDLEPRLATLSKEEWATTIDEVNTIYQGESSLSLNNEDLLTLMEKTNTQERQRLFAEAILTLKEIMREGIIDARQNEFSSQDSGTFYRPIEVKGRKRNTRIQTDEEALRLLRINMAGLDVDTVVSRSLYHILKKGVQPNLVYDEQLTKAREETIVANVEPVVVIVKEGESIIEPGTRINDEHIEKISAYREKLAAQDEIVWGFNIHFVQRAILTLGLLLAALIYIKVGVPNLKNSRKLALAAIVLLLNLVFIRIFFEFGKTELFGNSPTLLALLPYTAPIALSAIIVTIIIGSSSALLVSLMVSTLYSMMLGNSIESFIIGLLSSFIGIYFCRDIRLRVKVVRAGALAGLGTAICACFIGLINEIDFITISQQMLVAQIIGIFTGILVIGVLPLFENLFSFTTDITLLELTDFNHNLLRKLQIEAPGSYHHSLMVANLSERAASEINANALLCRATALFHDIGKITKPDYFIENQRDGINPHDEKNPNMSALVIKSHVKEGVMMAKEAKLPKVFIDIIQQHHGTTLIKFFYYKAIKANEQKLLPLSLSTSNAGLSDDTGVEEGSFRYDGPKPQFKESAIILLADCVEAASRSLKKATPQSIEEFVNTIVNDKIEDKQLDECPLTLQEIEKIKGSFCFTLINMLHSRIEYPNKEAMAKKSTKKGQTNSPIIQSQPSVQTSDIANDAPPNTDKRAAV